MKLDLASHSVEELISAALAECRGATSNREIRLDVKDMDSRLLVDLSLAKRVPVHLVANAQLYSSPGQPVRITREKHNKFHTISVADRGPGIEKEAIDHVFEKYYRGGKSEASRPRHRHGPADSKNDCRGAWGNHSGRQPCGARFRLHLQLASRTLMGL
jgi:K+-sensing histidine kinase KdpD